MAEENKKELPKKDIFAELAKVRTEPAPLVKISKNAKEAGDGEGTLTVDVYQDNDYIIVQSTIAGVKDEDLEVNITKESVTIHGKRERREEVKEKDYLYQELFWGDFSRSIILPYEVDPESSVATLKNGVLTIKMPKADKSRAKKLKVKSEEE
jgi:HSP20 family protein